MRFTVDDNASPAPPSSASKVQTPKKKPNRRATNLPRVPPGAMVRTFFLAMLAFAACVWAIASYVNRPRRSTVVPVAPASASSNEGEIPVPEVVPVE